jgi:type III secretory pathway component EscR
MERLDTMDMEQSLAFGRVAYSYKRYVDTNDENESNQTFKEILDNNELEDTSTMLKRDQVTYVCLPVPK